jgi:adenylate cyclase
MTRLRRALRRPAVASLLLGIAVFALVAGARELGLLQSAELFSYDKCLAWRSGADTTDPRIVLVEISESDINKYDFPVPDDLFAKLLDIIERGGPVAIGLDIYRDLPVPRDGSQLAELNRVLQQNQNIVGIFVFGDMEHPIKIPFAPALAEPPDRYGISDFPLDFGAVRRGFLLVWDKKNDYYPSFALALAMQTGVTTEQVGSGLRIGKALFPRFEHNEGGYVRADDFGLQFLLDFKSPRKFATYSLDDVLSKRVDEQVWHGKVVLIGEGAESAHDFLATPLQVNVPGVELHAQALNQLLRAAERGDRPTSSSREPAELAWIFAWCILGGVIGLFIRRPVASLAACCSLATALAVICWIAFTRNLWLPFMPALGGNLAAAASVIAYTRYQERKDRVTLMQLFSRHVSNDVAQSIWAKREEFMDGSRPRSQKLVATVLFTDLRNFSTVAEKIDAAGVMDWINEYMEALARHVSGHNGVINKYVGDSIMALFGFPVPRKTEEEIRRDAINAVRCALAMSTEIEELNKRWQEVDRPPAQMRVGIFTGPAVAGCIGSRDRLEFTVMGDTVNTASRLESFDKDYASEDACRILIGQSTFQLLDGQFKTEFVQSIELKGKHEKTTIYRVLGSNI